MIIRKGFGDLIITRGYGIIPSRGVITVEISVENSCSISLL